MREKHSLHTGLHPMLIEWMHALCSGTDCAHAYVRCMHIYVRLCMNAQVFPNIAAPGGMNTGFSECAKYHSAARPRKGDGGPCYAHGTDDAH